MSIDISQFHQTFFEECFEGLEVMESGLLNLDIGNADNEVINAIFRGAHSIKGGSATFGFTEVASFTHVMETLLDEMRAGQRDVTQSLIDILLRSVDCLHGMIAATSQGEPIDTSSVSSLQKELETVLGSTPVNSSDSSTIPPTSPGNAGDSIVEWLIDFKPHADMVRTGNDPVLLLREIERIGEVQIVIDTSNVPDFKNIDPESCYLSWVLTLTTSESEANIRQIFDWVEDECDLRIEKISNTTTPLPPQRDSAAIAAPDIASQPEKTGVKKSTAENSSIRVSIDKIDALINMVGELVITQSMMGQLDGNLEDFDVSKLEKLRDGLTLLERNTRELQESVMRIRMLPISFSFNRFPRMVRDLSQQLNKKINLTMSGEQTELDKTVMEKIGDPLVHLLRNSLDHGIETPEVRLSKGKPETGTIELNAYHKGGNIVIEISDDGAGFNKDKILAKAVENNLIGSNDDISDEKIYDLIFMPGFSTADTISDVSGRGVGMDVVKRNIRELGGNIDVTSEVDKGTTFTIRLPLTLAILDGQLLSVGTQTYIVPLVSIVESLQIKKENINSIAGKSEVYKLREDYIPILRLHDVFGIKASTRDLTDGLLVVIEGDGKKIGLYIDDLLGQQQVVIKSLESNYEPIQGISGATILGDGTVSLILDVEGLITLQQNINYSQDAA